MQLIELWRKDSRFDFTLGISNAISFEQWMNKLWWKTKTWGYTHKRNLKLFRPSSEILVHLKFRQHYKKCGAFCFKEGVNSYHVWDQSGIVNRVSKLESKPLLVNVAILVILWLYLRHGTIGNSVFAIKLTMPKNSWQSFKFLLITHHSLILKYFHLYKVISNHFPNVFYL